MNTSGIKAGVCMRFAVSIKPSFIRNNIPETAGGTNKQLTKRKIINLFFNNCDNCLTMAAIPQGVFAARKVCEYNQRRFLISKMEKKGGSDKDTGYSKKNAKEEGRELTPLKYNSKLMNSIWGLYNRYSVHNFKQNTDADDATKVAGYWGSAIYSRPPKTSAVENTMASQIHQFLTGTGNAKI